MKDLDTIKARLEVLPCIINESHELEICCPGGLEGTGIMDDWGHCIADAVLEPYVDFFVNAPEDQRRLIARVEQLETALALITTFPNQQSPYNPSTWDFEGRSLANGYFEGLDVAAEIARTALAEEDEE